MKRVNREIYLEWAKQTGPATYRTFIHALNTSVYPGPGTTFCRKVMNLSRQYDQNVIEAACETFQKNGGYPTLHMIRKYICEWKGRESASYFRHVSEEYTSCGITRGIEAFSNDITTINDSHKEANYGNVETSCTT